MPIENYIIHYLSSTNNINLYHLHAAVGYPFRRKPLTDKLERDVYDLCLRSELTSVATFIKNLNILYERYKETKDIEI